MTLKSINLKTLTQNGNFLGNKLVKHVDFLCLLRPLFLKILKLLTMFNRNPRQKHIPHLFFFYYNYSAFPHPASVPSLILSKYLVSHKSDILSLKGAPFSLLIPYIHLISLLSTNLVQDVDDNEDLYLIVPNY